MPLLAAVPTAEDSGPDVLRQRCLPCHGPDSRMGSLDLSTRESALRGGTRGPAISSTEPATSLLVSRVMDNEMPPGSPLPGEEKAILRKWLSSGAHWEAPTAGDTGDRWWSLQPLRDAVPPSSGASAAAWASSPVDQWIRAGLEKAGMQPAPEAERRDLIRRVSLTLTGLPPEPEDTEAFVRDGSPRAYERVVDRLLASPHYGERWARHWLDLVRFAESEGFERDLPRDYAWPYRDYVIRSFNHDKPYLQFAREQMAGDVMEPASREGVVATTMLTLGPVDAVGLTSAIPEERELIREDLLEEMVGTVSQTFLGLTVNCARCHDHKFDPIPQEEYYRMKAAFQAIWPPTRPVPEAGLDELFPHGSPLMTPAERAARDEQVRAIEGRIERIDSVLGLAFREARPGIPTDTAIAPLARWTFDVDGRADFSPLHLRFVRGIEARDGKLRPPMANDGGTEEPSEGADGGSKPGIAVSRKLRQAVRAKTLEVWIDVETVPEKSATVMEVRGLSGYRGASVDGIQFVAGDSPRWENYSVGRFRSADTGGEPEELQPGDRLHVAVTYSTNGTIALYRNGAPYGAPYRPDASIAAGRLQVYRAGDALVRFPASKSLHVAEARLYGRALEADEVRISYSAGVRDHSVSDLLARMSIAERQRVNQLERERGRLLEELESIPAPDLAHSVSVSEVRPTYVLIRGTVGRRGKEVLPGGLSCIESLPQDLGLSAGSSEGARRSAMAEWIANPKNPLFARVIANRVWQLHFGRGIVENPSDLGLNGGLPSHPGLLDWLASDLVHSGWSLKALHKRILMSATFRQSSRFDDGNAAKDAENRFLWRFPPRRLDAEAVRDSMLSVSADLNRETFGPSFRPFEFGEARGSLRRYLLKDDDGPAMRRRTLYRMNVITGGDPMLESLDCPLPSVKTPQRRSTTTPLQALSLMNNTFVQRRALGFAKRLRGDSPDLGGQVRRAFQVAFGRSPDEEELERSLTLAERHGLEALTWGILNASEFLYVR